MIFSNEGHTQVSGNPFRVTDDLSHVVRLVREHLIKNGLSQEEADTLIVLAGKMAGKNEAEMITFFAKIPKDVPLNVIDIANRFDEEFG